MDPTYSLCGKAFYVNGMTATREEAKRDCDAIAAKSCSSVELHHNNTTSSSDFGAMIAKAAIGAVGLLFATAPRRRSKKRAIVDIGIAVASTASIASAAHDYGSIQKRKNASAVELARKVKAHLVANPLCDVTLIFHSQGADIGQKALNLLRDYRFRIRVVTLGAMVTLPEGSARDVTNFRNANDLVSKIATTFFHAPGKGTRSTIVLPRASSPHSVASYLAASRVASELFAG